MIPAEFVARAAARGIDLKAVAGAASNLDGIAGERRLSRDERDGRRKNVVSMDILLTARGKETRTYRRPMYTHAEVGQSAYLCPRMPWLAACYSFAGNTSEYVELHRGLTHQAIKFADREKWPLQIRKTKKPKMAEGELAFYIEELGQLVLVADAHCSHFLQFPCLYAIFMDVSDDTWSQSIAAKYATLRGVYDRWLGVAQGYIARRLRDDIDAESDGENAFDPTNPAAYHAEILAAVAR
jgi:hypothetical protein